jgi:hypothetical protein
LTKSKPPVTRVTQELPFDKLSPRDFERLCLWLVEREGYEQAEHLGAAGSEQGRDVIARRDGRLWAFQCKRVRRFGPKAALEELNKVRALQSAERPVGLVFIVTCDVSVKTRTDVRKGCQKAHLECAFWTGTELDQKVKQHPEILNEFFQLPRDRSEQADWSDTCRSSSAALHAGFTDWINITDQIVNPGFEDGFLGWEEDSSIIDGEQADSKSMDDSTEAHTGSHSRKLFLRWGGSYIKQTIKLTNPLPAQCQIRLGVHAKMPFCGSSANKWFTLMLVAQGGGRDQVDYAQAKPPGALVEWTRVTALTEQLDYPIHKLEIHALTTKGGGAHKGFDKPVWVDDFTIEYRSPYAEESPRHLASSDVDILAAKTSLRTTSNEAPDELTPERVPYAGEGGVDTVIDGTLHQLIAKLANEFKLVRKTLEHNLRLPLDDTLQSALKMPTNEIKATIAPLDFEELTEAAQDYLVQAASINALVDRYNDVISTGKGRDGSLRCETSRVI